MKTDRYEIKWLDSDESILYVYMFDKWAWDDVEELTALKYEMVESVDHCVYVVVNLEYSHLPSDAISNVARALGQSHENESLMFIISGNNALQSVFAVIGKLFDVTHQISNTRFVLSMDEALEQIENHRRQKSVNS